MKQFHLTKSALYILWATSLFVFILISNQVPEQERGLAATEEPTTDPGKVYLPLITAGSVPVINQLSLNPSFEAQPDGFAYWQQLTPEVSYNIVNNPAVAHDGQQYLAMNRQGGAFGNKSFYQEINSPQAGKTYQFSIWVRASAEAIAAGKPRAGRVALWAYGGAPVREHSTWNFQLYDTNWHCVETSLTVSQSGHPYLRAEVYLTSLDSFDYYFDLASLRDDGQATCSPPPSNDGATLISYGQGFDICAAPTVAQLNAWKQASPYQYFGIYLGGVNHYSPCKAYNQQYQTPAWFTAVLQQGWQFIPTWVGPQAPCTGYAARFSYDTTTARSEGIAEAQQALAAAQTLGLISAAKPKTIIYYDMEYYSTSNSTCHNAANAFLEGWVSELQNQGHKAGIYGSVYAVNGWYTLRHVPDSVWVPRYIQTGYNPSMSVSVLNQQWITPSYWANHRLFQYSNSHTEGWGGINLNIDNDTASGLVALEEPTSAYLRGMQLLSPGQGWLWLDQQLFWTETGGTTWSQITPPDAATLDSIFFLDTAHAWVVSTHDNDAQFYLSRTLDSGQTWQSFPLAALKVIDPNLPTSAVYLDFITPDTGWLAVKLAGGLNFSQGLLFKTNDGGTTWTPLTLPLGAPVYFISETVGWTAGGPTQGELYMSRDGGQSWTVQAIRPQTDYPVYQLPHFENESEGAIAVTIREGGWSRVELYGTNDGGRSWQLSERLDLAEELALGVSPPLQILDGQRWLVAAPGSTPLFPDQTVAFDFVSDSLGWAHVRQQSCNPLCQVQSRLFQTGDGGQSWRELDLSQTP